MGLGPIAGLDVDVVLCQDHLKQLGGLQPAVFSPLLPEAHIAGTLDQVLHDPFPQARSCSSAILGGSRIALLISCSLGIEIDLPLLLVAHLIVNLRLFLPGRLFGLGQIYR